MSKKYERRVSELIRMHLAELLERELNDPRVNGAQVTITDVEITPDTRHAKVFYSLIGDEDLKAEVARGLNLECRRFDLEPEITAKIVRRGYAIHEVPIAYKPRQEKKLSPWRDGWPALRALWRYRRWRG